jgi:hypothetical protein
VLNGLAAICALLLGLLSCWVAAAGTIVCGSTADLLVSFGGC